MRAFFTILVLLAFAPAAMAEPSTYVCPMHPYITGHKGDHCPICGMELVPQKSDKNPQARNELSIDPSYVQTLGVKTSQAALHEFGRNIKAYGRLEPSTRLEHSVDVRTAGWIVDLPASAVGDTVKKGDLLFTYYSPDLMTAQSDYLIGKRIGDGEQRLRLYGMDEQAIALLKKKGKFLEATPFHAPVDGTVMDLKVRKGTHVAEGGHIMILQDYSKLWVMAQVPLAQAQFLKIGLGAEIKIPETGKTYKSAVDFIEPMSDPQSRTVQVRLILDNEDGTLKPETYADVVFDADTQERLAVPNQAVLYDGSGAHVIEALGNGHFRPVMVQTGISTNGLTEITNGLQAGQKIVTSGQFMLDAESNLRGGMAHMDHMKMEDKDE